MRRREKHVFKVERMSHDEFVSSFLILFSYIQWNKNSIGLCLTYPQEKKSQEIQQQKIVTSKDCHKEAMTFGKKINEECKAK